MADGRVLRALGLRRVIPGHLSSLKCNQWCLFNISTAGNWNNCCLLLVLMLKRSERSSCSSFADRPTPKLNKQKSEGMKGNQEIGSLTSMETLLDKLIAIEFRMEDNFSNLHTQISELTCEFKHVRNQCRQINIEWVRKVCESSVGKHRGPTARVQISQRFKKHGWADCGNSRPESRAEKAPSREREA